MRQGSFVLLLVISGTAGCGSEDQGKRREERAARGAAPAGHRPNAPRDDSLGVPKADAAAAAPDLPIPSSSLALPARTHVYPTQGPKQRPQIVWKTKETTSHAHVAISVEGVIVTGVSGNDLLAFDRQGGGVLWRWRNAVAPAPASSICGKVAEFLRPAVVDGVVYSVACLSVMLALDARSGKPHWTRDLALDHAMPPKGAFPIVTPELVLGLFARRPGDRKDTWELVALDRRTGATRWTQRRDGDPLDLAAAGQRVFVSGTRGLWALDLVTG